MKCKTCHGDAYYWDSLVPCGDCAEGKAIKYKNDKQELKALNARARKLRKAIKQWEIANGYRNDNRKRN